MKPKVEIFKVNKDHIDINEIVEAIVDYNVEQNEIENQRVIEDLENTIENLEDDLQSLQSDYDELESRMKSLEK